MGGCDINSRRKEKRYVNKALHRPYRWVSPVSSFSVEEAGCGWSPRSHSLSEQNRDWKPGRWTPGPVFFPPPSTSLLYCVMFLHVLARSVTPPLHDITSLPQEELSTKPRTISLKDIQLNEEKQRAWIFRAGMKSKLLFSFHPCISFQIQFSNPPLPSPPPHPPAAGPISLKSFFTWLTWHCLTYEGFLEVQQTTSITSHMPACSSGWPGNVGLVLHFLFELGLSSSFFFSFLPFCDLRWWFIYLCIAMQHVGSQFPEPLALKTQTVNPCTIREVPRLSS